MAGRAASPTTSTSRVKPTRASCARRTRTPVSCASTSAARRRAGGHRGPDRRGRRGRRAPAHPAPPGADESARGSAESRDGSPFFIAPHPAVATDPVRFVGEPVAMVVAETLGRRGRAPSGDGRLRAPAAGQRGRAAPRRAARVGEHGSNVCVDSHAGDSAATEAAFARAAHVVRLDTWMHRVTGVPMEPRAAVGAYDAATERYTAPRGRRRRDP